MECLKNQVAVVTGASSGIGRAIALALATEGATVSLVGRHAQRLASVAESARVSACRVHVYRADLNVIEDLKRLKVDLQRDCGQIDMLVHSAGVIFLGPIADAPVEEFDRQYRTNIRGPFILTQTLLPLLRQHRGQIVFINSSAGLSSQAHLSQYSATKHALKALADSLRQELNAEGIRVLSVYPGRTATPLQAEIHGIEGKEYFPERLLQPEDVAAVVINALRMERTAEITNIHIRPMKKT